MNRPAMVMGIETEYSIYVRQPSGMNYELAVGSAGKTMLDCVRSSIEAMGEQVIITRNGLHPGVQHIANGARFYLDSLHPEMSTSECQNPRDVVIWDAAGERIVQTAAERASKDLGFKVSIYKKLVDGHGHTWGCHDNFCITPELFFRITKDDVRNVEQKTLATWLVVRQLLTGAGKIGTDNGGIRSAFQLSQRADFIIQFRNPHTMVNRPLINTRDEALADEDDWRRLHLICGDANLCQWSTYLKMALTGLLLLLWQDGNLDKLPALPIIVDADYARVMRFISRDPDMVGRYPIRIAVGRNRLGDKKYMSAAEILSYYTDALAAYARQRSWSSPAEADAYRQATQKAQWAAELLKNNQWRSLYGWLDWPTKRIVAEEYLRRKNKNWTDVLTDEDLLRRVRTLGDINYTALDPATSLFARLAKAGIIKTAVKSSEVVRAILRPPPGRATVRAMLISAYSMWVIAAHWNNLLFYEGTFRVQVLLNDPAGCDQEQMETALRASPTPSDFVEHLRRFPITGIFAKIELRKTDA